MVIKPFCYIRGKNVFHCIETCFIPLFLMIYFPESASTAPL